MSEEARMIQNAVLVNGVPYKSIHRHDYVGLPDGRAIDGGLAYRRFNGAFQQEEDLALFTDDDEEKVYQNFVWVTDFNHPRTTMFIKDMSLSQLRSIRANLHPNDRISPDVFDFAIKRREFDEDDGA